MTATAGERGFRRGGEMSRFIGFTSFLQLRFELGNQRQKIDAVLDQLRAAEAEAQRRIAQAGLTPIQTTPFPFSIVVFGMTAFMDGGKIDTPDGYLDGMEDAKQRDIDAKLLQLPDDGEKRLKPQDWQDYHAKLDSLAAHLASRGFDLAFCAFADAEAFMPDQHEQQAHLDACVDTLRPHVNAFIRTCNEATRHGRNGVYCKEVKPSNPGEVLWCSGDYDVEQREDYLDVCGPCVEYHGPRGKKVWVNEAKEANFRFVGWNDVAAGKWGKATFRPNYDGEPECFATKPKNRWGDARETDAGQYADYGRSMALVAAGAAYHCENACLSRLMDANEFEACVEFLIGMLSVPCAAIFEPYCHDPWPCYPAEPAPVIGQEGSELIFAAGESLSKTVGDRAWTATANPVAPFQPQPRDGWQLVARTGPHGNHLTLKR